MYGGGGGRGARALSTQTIRICDTRRPAAELQELLAIERVLAAGCLGTEASWGGGADTGAGGGGMLRGLSPLSKPLGHDSEENGNHSIRCTRAAPPSVHDARHAAVV